MSFIPPHLAGKPLTDRPLAVTLMHQVGLDPDPWQIQVLETDHRQILLNCCRQAGKSTVIAMLALSEALSRFGVLILLLSPSLRQSDLLFGIVSDFYRRLGSPYDGDLTAHELRLKNLSRIVSLPSRPDTVRGFSRVHMLVIDEAAHVQDALYRAVRPMLAVSNGRTVLLSTPWGRRGFFYEAWFRGRDWLKIEVPATQVSRISPAWLEQERLEREDAYFRREYMCSFEAGEGLVYPDFARCEVDMPAFMLHRAFDPRQHKPRGGIDFGFRNPFAAVWGVQHDDVLWLIGEHYQRHQPLSYHAERLPKGVFWYADPASPGEIEELIRGNLSVRKGTNDIRQGIMAVSARLKDGRLKIVKGACPNLLREAALYRYSDDPLDRRAETPVDEHRREQGAWAGRSPPAHHTARTLVSTRARPRPRERFVGQSRLRVEMRRVKNASPTGVSDSRGEPCLASRPRWTSSGSHRPARRRGSTWTARIACAIASSAARASTTSRP
jgi:hypothetical protein